MELEPKRFIGESIEVEFDRPPMLEKKPGCPDRFSWREQTYQVVELLNEWHDYRRRGRMARNMKPEHAAVAQHRGSWGVGQDFYRVLTDAGRFFDLYFDRAPRSVDDRKGGWFLDKELQEKV